MNACYMYIKYEKENSFRGGRSAKIKRVTWKRDTTNIDERKEKSDRPLRIMTKNHLDNT